MPGGRCRNDEAEGMMLNGESLPFRQRLSSGLLNRGSGTGDKQVPDEP
jgi:hypothetical protein